MAPTPTFDESVVANLQAGGRYSSVSRTMNGGMMEARARTAHFSAKDTATGARLHIKVTPSRGQSATLEQEQLAGHERLQRLTQRILAIEKDRKQLGLPVVEILDAVMLPAPAAQVTVMKSVRCVRDVLSTALDLSLAIRILRQLCSPKMGGWIHFDICPSNTGIDDNGAPLLIDVDSIYKPDGGYEAISYPACKTERMSTVLVGRIRSEATRADLLLKKHDDDVLLLAAECCLGLLGAKFERANIDDWIDNSLASNRVRQLWKPILMDLVDGTGRPALEVAAQLEALLGEASSTKTTDAPALETITSWSGFSKWSQLLRKELLSAQQIEAYLKRLLELGPTIPTPDIWKESSYISLVYLKDLKTTKNILAQALEKHPEDAELRERSEQTKVWPDDHNN